VDANMPVRIFVVLFLLAISASAQTLPVRPLELPKDEDRKQPDSAKQLAECRAQADKGDPDAAFQLGLSYLIGQGVVQDAATAEQYFAKTQLAPARMCLVAETYMETALPGRVDAAMRWVQASKSGCTYWAQAQWYEGNQLGPDPQKEAQLLRKGLELPNNDYRFASQRRLGELLLTGTAIAASESDKVAWIGAAARAKLGQAENSIAWLYAQHPDEAAVPEASLEWTRKAARYGVPAALAALGQAAMARSASDLTHLDGMALFAMGLREDLLSGSTLEMQIKLLEPEQREELANAVAKWEKIAQETGGYYTKDDPLRLPAPADEADLTRQATAANPDAELRLAYLHQSKGQLAKAEAVYREVWKNGASQLLFHLGKDAADSGKWSWARELYIRAADAGSRAACAALAHIDGEGMAGKRDALSAYLWLIRAGTHDQAQLAARKNAVSAADLKAARVTQASWIIAHKEYWPNDAKAAQAILDAQPQIQFSANGFHPVPQKPAPSTEELKSKGDAGDADAAYALALRLLWDEGSAPKIAEIEHYASLGAKTADQKAHIGDGYERSEIFDAPTRRKYAEKWWLAVGGSRSGYWLGKLYNGKSDGTVETDDEKKAVAYWQQAVSAGEERWARLARMELGYRVIKGWTSGNRANDANWAHELAMEFLAKEFYEVAGEYSYGRELPHNSQTFTRLAERAAIYNSDNAQSQVAQSILGGEWKQRNETDAYVWMKLHAVKQDTSDQKQVESAEKNPEFKRKLDARFNVMLKTRSESGAFYPEDDPLRTTTFETLEPLAAALDPEAQFRLGTLLEQQGTADSLARAIELYRRLWATSGREVRLIWGRLLMHGGPGVERDDVGAEKWLWDAANAGSHEACRDLAVIYGEGRGVKADAVAAEAWRELADRSVKPLSDLTGAQMQAVNDRIADWLAKHPNW
jgi:TPR repeat protein